MHHAEEGMGVTRFACLPLELFLPNPSLSTTSSAHWTDGLVAAWLPRSRSTLGDSFREPPCEVCVCVCDAVAAGAARCRCRRGSDMVVFRGGVLCAQQLLIVW